MDSKEFEIIFSGKKLKSRIWVGVVDGRFIYFGDLKNTHIEKLCLFPWIPSTYGKHLPPAGNSLSPF